MNRIHPIMQASIEHFKEVSRSALMPQAVSDLPQLAANLGDESDPVARLSYAGYFAAIEALRAALPLIDGTDEDSERVRGQIVAALVAAGEPQQVAA